MSCRCAPYHDLRIVCHPSKKTWKQCSVRAQTAYYLMKDDIDTYKLIEQKTIYKVKTYLKKNYKITDKDYLQIVKWYEEDLSSNSR